MKRIIVCISLMLILVGCSNKYENNVTNNDKVQTVNTSTQLSEDKTTLINKLKVKNEELQATIDSIQTDFNYKKEEAEYYKQLIDDLIQDYSDTQLKDLAKKLWDYNLKINGVSIPINGVVEIKENNIEISLIESQAAYLILPNEIYIQGQISGNYIDHLKMDSSPTETYVTDGTVVTAIHHKFVDVDTDSKISISITEELKTRLGLETTQITINKK